MFMVVFEKLDYIFFFFVEVEWQYLLQYKVKWSIFGKREDCLLIVIWNVVNLGLYECMEVYYQLIVEIMSWFDIVVVQEVYDDFSGLYQLEFFIGFFYEFMFIDWGGNDEWVVYFYDISKVEWMFMIGELAIEFVVQWWIWLLGVEQAFCGFDCNLYIGSFQFCNYWFMLVNVYFFFGGMVLADMNCWVFEVYVVGCYVDLCWDDEYVFFFNIIVLGDFNIFIVVFGDLIYDVFFKCGLMVLKYFIWIVFSIFIDVQYDQVVFFLSLKCKIKNSGVFDYDMAVFFEFWDCFSEEDFKLYCWYYILDYWLMWMEVDFD